MKKIILTISIVLSMFIYGCSNNERQVEIIPTQQSPVVIQQQNNAGEIVLGAMAGIAIGQMISNGHGGQVPYNGSNYPRTIVRNTTIINKTVTNKTVAAPVSTPAPAVAAPVAPAKVKNPGDAAAEAEKAKMKAEADAKSAQQAKQAQLKADLQAKQAARASAPVSKPSGFNTMSKGASSSTRRK